MIFLVDLLIWYFVTLDQNIQICTQYIFIVPLAKNWPISKSVQVLLFLGAKALL